MSNERKVTPIVNVKNAVYAVMTDVDAETYGEVKSISKSMSIKCDTDSSSDDLYGDGELSVTETSVGKTTLELQLNDMPLAVHADLMGHTLDPETGTMVVKSNDVVPYVAVGFMLPKGNGGKNRYYWFYKGKFQEMSLEANQKEDKTTYNTPTITGTFVNNKDGERNIVMDEDEGTAPPADFLTKVYKISEAAGAAAKVSAGKMKETNSQA